MAIQQHPLPQDISSYRFRLIGDMTIKQFGMLAAGIIIAIIFYSSPLPFFFKYPLAFIFLVLGIGSAFVPVQGRPLDQWILAFIKSIYSPTQYIWRQSAPEEITKATPQATTPSPTHQTPQIIPSTPPTPEPPVPEPVPTPEPESLLAPKPEAITPSAPEPVIPSPTPPEEPQEEMPVPAPTPSTKPESTTTPAPSTNLPIPFTPTTPNTLVGLTLTPDERILENVLVEILSGGQTIRATKSNRLGQFMFARPLEKGLYQIAAEKPGFQFSTYSIELTDKIVSPLKIQAVSSN